MPRCRRSRLLYGRTLIDTLHERVGEEEHLRGRSDLNGSQQFNGGWARVIGQHGQRDGDPAGILGSGPKFDYDFIASRAGTISTAAEHADGSRDHAGLYVAAGLANATSRISPGWPPVPTSSPLPAWRLLDPFRALRAGISTASCRAPGMMPEATPIAGLGALSTSGAGLPPRSRAVIRSGSAAAGRSSRRRKSSTRPSACPTAATAPRRCRFSDVDSLAAAIGARIAKTWSARCGAATAPDHAWIRPNLWHEFLGDPITAFSSATGFLPFRSDLGGNWAEINAGVSTALNRTTDVRQRELPSGLDGRSFASTESSASE